MKEPERTVSWTPELPEPPKGKAVIMFVIEQDSKNDAFLNIDAQTRGLSGGEDSMLAVLEAYVAHIKALKTQEQSS